MAEIGGRLKDNAFTNAGFAALDDIAAAALRRGRQGRGCDIELQLASTGDTYPLDPSRISAIQDAVTSTTLMPADAVRCVAMIVHGVIK